MKETDTKNTKKIVKIREKVPKPTKKPKQLKMTKTKLKQPNATKSTNRKSPRERKSKSRKIKTILQLNEANKMSPKSIKARFNEKKNIKRAAKERAHKEKLENRAKKISVKDALIQNILDYSKLVKPLVKPDTEPQKPKKLTINQILENLHNNNNNKSSIKTVSKPNLEPMTSSKLNDTNIQTISKSYSNMFSKQSHQNEILEERLNNVSLDETNSDSFQLQAVETKTNEKIPNESLRNQQQTNKNILIVNLNVVEGNFFFFKSSLFLNMPLGININSEEFHVFFVAFEESRIFNTSPSYFFSIGQRNYRAPKYL